MVDSPYFTVPEAAAYCKCSKSLLDNLRVKGGGPIFIKVEGTGVKRESYRVIYDRSDLDEWLRRDKWKSTSVKAA